MDILLVDIHHEGHHLEYASYLQKNLREVNPELDVHFLTLSHRDVHDEFFEENDISYIYDSNTSLLFNSNTFSENIRRALVKPREDIIEDLSKEINKPDIVHFLHIDDIIKELLLYGDEIETPVLGTINGGFFRTQSDLRIQAADSLIGTGISGSLAKAVPNIFSRRGPWNILYLYKLLENNIIEDIFVNSEPGKKMLEKTCRYCNGRFTTIPEPVEPWFEDNQDPSTAREKLGLSEKEFIITFFGEIRKEKGVDILLDALNSYTGPEFTCVIAGRPKSMSESDFRDIDAPYARIKTFLDYIPQEDVRAFYEASDCIILPYRQLFGNYRRSGTFQKACSAGKPIIGPNFGRFNELITKYDLGITFEAGSSESLTEALETTVVNKGNIYSKKRMEEYIADHTYEKLAEELMNIYDKYLL